MNWTQNFPPIRPRPDYGDLTYCIRSRGIRCKVTKTQGMTRVTTLRTPNSRLSRVRSLLGKHTDHKMTQRRLRVSPLNVSSYSISSLFPLPKGLSPSRICFQFLVRDVVKPFRFHRYPPSSSSNRGLSETNYPIPCIWLRVRPDPVHPLFPFPWLILWKGGIKNNVDHWYPKNNQN